MGETRKAWVSALASGAMAAAAYAYNVDFTAIGANDIRDLVLAFVLAALTAGGVTYAVPNKKPQV